MARYKSKGNVVNPIGNDGDLGNSSADGVIIGGAGVNDPSESGAATVDPGTLAGTTAIGSDGNVNAPKRRGRKPGSKNSATKAAISVSGIELMLYSSHQLLAAVSKTPELMLSESEANTLAKAVAGVAEHYEFLATASAEAIAWANLVQCVALTYGTRLFAYKARKAKEQRLDDDNQNVINMTGNFSNRGNHA